MTKSFADKVFPAIDENIFVALYSDKASRPNTPINVIVGALILKETLSDTDDELVEAIMFDIRYPYALYTTRFVEQPLSDRTLSRFRAHVLAYEIQHNVDLIHECTVKMAKEHNINLATTNFTRRKPDDIYAEFSFTEDGHFLIVCIYGCTPEVCTYISGD